MAISKSAEGINRDGVPRWILLIPLVAGFLVLLEELFGGGWVSGSSAYNQAVSVLSWTLAIFPHILAFPLIPFLSEPWQICAVVSALDAALVAAIWTTQPPQLSWTRLTIILGAWVALSVVTTLSAADWTAWGYSVIR